MSDWKWKSFACARVFMCQIEEKFVSILVGNKNANDIAPNDANMVCDLDATNGIIAVTKTIQLLRQLQQWYGTQNSKTNLKIVNNLYNYIQFLDRSKQFVWVKDNK